LNEKKTVFIVNKSSHDYSSAEDFGNLVFMTQGSLQRFSTSKMFRTFEPFIKASKTFDYLLLSGMTVMCSVACAMFAHKHGRINLLIHKPNPRNSGSYQERVIVMGGEYNEKREDNCLQGSP